jgi:DNA invertase Pin-like site-specific DNA recombinase
MKSFIYLRTSTEDQNPENQKKDVLQIAPEGAEIVIEKQSAWKDHLNNRPLFKQIYDSVKKGGVDVLCVWDLDRLFRNRLKAVEFLRLCKVKGCEVRSYRQQWLTEFKNIPSPWNEILEEQMIQIFGWMAEEESNKKSERVRIAFENHQGKKWGRPVVDVSEQKQELVLSLRSQGKSIRSIAEIVGLKKNQVEKIVRKNAP